VRIRVLTFCVLLLYVSIMRTRNSFHVVGTLRPLSLIYCVTLAASAALERQWGASPQKRAYARFMSMFLIIYVYLSFRFYDNAIDSSPPRIILTFKNAVYVYRWNMDRAVERGVLPRRYGGGGMTTILF
jgi:hypothetical protein